MSENNFIDKNVPSGTEGAEAEADAQKMLMDIYLAKKAQMTAARDNQPEGNRTEGAKEDQRPTRCARCGADLTNRPSCGGLCMNCYDAQLIAEHDKRQREYKQSAEGRAEKLNRMLRHISGYIPNSPILSDAFRNRNWTNCTVDADNQTAVQLLKKYSFGFDQIMKAAAQETANTGLFICGDLGTGKTYLSSCICNQLLQDGYSCVIDTETGIVESIRATFGNKSQTAGTAEDVTNLYKTCNLLIIDDVRKSQPTAWTCETMFKIINYRMDNGRPVIVTSNYSLQELYKIWIPKDSRDVTTANAVIDRILYMTVPVTMTGASRRGLSVVKGGAA